MIYVSIVCKISTFICGRTGWNLQATTCWVFSFFDKWLYQMCFISLSSACSDEERVSWEISLQARFSIDLGTLEYMWGGGGWGIHDKPADCWWYSSNWFKIKFVCDPESWKLLWILEKYFSLFFEVQTTLKISHRHWGMFKLKNHITVWTEVKQLKKVWKRVVWKVGKRSENQFIDL